MRMLPNGPVQYATSTVDMGKLTSFFEREVMVGMSEVIKGELRSQMTVFPSWNKNRELRIKQQCHEDNLYNISMLFVTWSHSSYASSFSLAL